MATSENPMKQTDNSERFESDAKKLADRHLADPNHVITDEELRSIRVGVTPTTADAPTEEAVVEADDRVADRKVDSEEDTVPGAQKITPWDVVE